MKLIATLLATTTLLAVAPARQEMPQPAEASENHAWLRQLLGEWDVHAEMVSAPDVEPMIMESTESVRSFGDLWILAEGKATLFGQEVGTLMTLGYDPERKVFVGSWIDTMNAYMWTYEGRLDDERQALTLEARGPAYDEPGRMALYRDRIRLVGPDEKRLTSSIQLADGTWSEFMQATYRRAAREK